MWMPLKPYVRAMSKINAHFSASLFSSIILSLFSNPISSIEKIIIISPHCGQHLFHYTTKYPVLKAVCEILTDCFFISGKRSFLPSKLI
jgi:hypothetical protein